MPSQLKRGRTPTRREGKGYLSPRRANIDSLCLHLGFFTASLLSSSGSIVYVSEKINFFKGITCAKMFLSR